MARPLGVEYPGAVYHITSQGNARQHIFDDDPVNGIYTTRHYRRFVRDCIGQPSIWEGLKGQALLGEVEFVEKLLDYVRGYEDLKEIPRRQRYLDRPSLERIFAGRLSRGRRDGLIVRAVHRYGYSQREVAEHLGLHYATVSRLANPVANTRNKT